MAECISDEEIEVAKRKIKDFIGVGNQLTISKDQLKKRGLSIRLSPGSYPLYVVIDALVRENISVYPMYAKCACPSFGGGAIQQFKIGRIRKADNALNLKRRNVLVPKPIVRQHLKGASVIFVPASAPEEADYLWEARLKARAY